ncbi:MAG: PAC2 family protein [Nitrososphaerota archaeon]|nr:PAC2 family protein [Nitrososphaerota archaeon]MDG6917987.1 PAC2 family protein [Nitrososphaerota archaeon]
MPEGVEIRASRGEPEKLTGGAVIGGFPESGLAGTIASTCLVSSLKLAMVGEMSSDAFPPLATVLNGRLQAPARIYAEPRPEHRRHHGRLQPGAPGFALDCQDDC